jgi:putative Mg2+ transporter-C (MgtC) family protein
MLAAGQGVGEVLREEFAGLWDGGTACRVTVRLLVALGVGALLGYERGQVGKAAGLRTYMLVSLAAALFTLTPAVARMGEEAVSRVVQGVAAGIGFIGGGAILKLTDQRQIRGLTTAAGIWLAAAAGAAAGLGRHGVALAGAVLGFLVLSLLGRVEEHIERRQGGGQEP